MDDQPAIEHIDRDLEELMERFFSSSLEEVDAMRAALARGDYRTLVRLGHTAKGTGYGYGFRGMGDIGQALETAARAGDAAKCHALVERMAHYLSTVQVEFID
jgi:HPt (histidine-containing phosphotransfer) domain-containing protein